MAISFLALRCWLLDLLAAAATTPSLIKTSTNLRRAQHALQLQYIYCILFGFPSPGDDDDDVDRRRQPATSSYSYWKTKIDTTATDHISFPLLVYAPRI
jgi:hypothetical protein